MRTRIGRAQIHRFNDFIALYVGTKEYQEVEGHTAYFTPEEARQLANALHRYAMDARRVGYLESGLGTYHLNIDAGGE
jgi:hypothetical protein